MLRIAQGVAARKNLKFILPDYVYVLHLDSQNPEKMKVEFIEKKDLPGEDHKLFLAPEVLSGG